MNIKTLSDFRAAMRNGPYAWPGGYPLYFVTNDGAALSFEAVRENLRLVIDSIANDMRDGWRVIACDVNWEDDSLLCDHTHKPIPCAYENETEEA